jgi:hypothetical protein
VGELRKNSNGSRFQWWVTAKDLTRKIACARTDKGLILQKGSYSREELLRETTAWSQA